MGMKLGALHEARPGVILALVLAAALAPAGLFGQTSSRTGAARTVAGKVSVHNTAAAAMADTDPRLEVKIAQPMIRSYTRIFPLLDGMFQDIAAIQAQQLSLYVTNFNGSAFNATAFSAGVQAGFNSFAGAENKLGLQQASATLSAASAGSATQAQLAQLQKLQQQAYTTLQSAVQTASSDAANASSTSATLTSDATAVTQAATAYNTINTAVQGLEAAPAATTLPAYNNPMSALLAAPAAQASAPTLANAPAPWTPSSLSLPPTELMGEQVDLLWQRLGRLAATMMPTFGASPVNTYLLAIPVSIFPAASQHKNRQLQLDFQLVCEVQGGKQPVVVDLYPREAALNTVHANYHSLADGLGLVGQFLGFGAQGSLNWQHVQLDQAAGEDSYISGYGIGTSEFGWMLSPKLGDDALQPGQRTLYALVDTTGCTYGDAVVSVGTDGVAWRNQSDLQVLTTTADQWRICDASVGDCGDDPPALQITGLDYSTGEPGTLANLVLTLSAPIDPADRVSINGHYLSRAFDSFGRGSAGNIAGALDMSAAAPLGPDQWLPVSPTELFVTLNPNAYTGSFPDILIEGPDHVARLDPTKLTQLEANGQIIEASGLGVRSRLPPLGYAAVPAAVAMNADRYQNSSTYHFMLTVADTSPEASAPAAQGPVLLGGPGEQPEWGPAPAVEVIGGDGDAATLADCKPSDDVRNTMDCTAPIKDPAPPGDYTVLLMDAGHLGGPITARADLGPTGPFVRSISQIPEWSDKRKAWTFTLSVANLGKVEDVALTTAEGDKLSAHFHVQGTAGVVTTLTMSIPGHDYPQLGDTMLLCLAQDCKYPQTIYSLRTLLTPRVADVDSQQESFSGVNLGIVTQLKVHATDDQGNPASDEYEALQCYGEQDLCTVNGRRFNKYGSGGLLFVLSDDSEIPVVKTSGSGLTPVMFVPPAPGAANKAASSSALKMLYHPGLYDFILKSKPLAIGHAVVRMPRPR